MERAGSQWTKRTGENGIRMGGLFNIRDQRG